MQQVTMNDDGTGHVWRLLKQTNKGSETEEVVFMVNGIVCGMDLPPVYKIPK